MQNAWQQADALIRHAGICEGPPPPEAPMAVSSVPSEPIVPKRAERKRTERRVERCTARHAERAECRPERSQCTESSRAEVGRHTGNDFQEEGGVMRSWALQNGLYRSTRDLIEVSDPDVADLAREHEDRCMRSGANGVICELGVSNIWKANFLSYLFGITAIPAPPATMYIGAYTVMPADDGTGGTEVTIGQGG